MDDFKIKIQEDFAYMTNNIFVYRDVHNGTVDVMNSDGVTVTNQKRSDPIKATIQMSNETLANFMDALSKRHFKPKEASYTEGKLESTEKHLADMRKLLKLDN